VNLRIPGPTPCPPEVLEAMSGQMIDHRGPEFSDLFKRVSGRLKSYFQTTNDVLLLTSSGTGAMEAAVVNTLSPGDKVLAVSIGSFGDRFASIAERYGANVTKMDVEWGKARMGKGRRPCQDRRSASSRSRDLGSPSDTQRNIDRRYKPPQRDRCCGQG
jgi:aspartate aminotransferase-like enzyme